MGGNVAADPGWRHARLHSLAHEAPKARLSLCAFFDILPAKKRIMRARPFILALLWGLFIPLQNFAALSSAPLHIFAAASLTDALKEIAGSFEQETGHRVLFNFAGSDILARQIEAGAPADIFFSADEAKMDALAGNGLLVGETRKNQLSNTLVVVVPSDSTLQFATLEDLASERVSRIATGNPRSVPVGVYARRYLEKAGLWARLEPKIVATENTRAALAAVESGNMDVGIVYKTDAAISKKVKVAWEFPALPELPIVYPRAALKSSSQIDRATAYLRFLDTSAAKAVFEKHGFIVLPEVSGPK
jgi:molybdate transport system substrate-binding protein